jgi:hypothetical protein
MAFPELTAYFTAEKQGGLLLVAMAAGSFALGGWLLATKHLFAAMAWPLLVLGALELVIGITVAGRAGDQAAAIGTGLRHTRAATVTSEVERMARINGTFELLKKVEVALIAVGLAFAVIRPAPATLGAIGLGLALQCAGLLVFDTFAHHRAQHYVQWLIALPPAASR